MKIVPGMPLQKKIVLLSILKLINYNNPTTTTDKITDVYIQISEILNEKKRARTTVTNTIKELIMIGMIKEVSVKKGRGKPGREVALDVPSGKALEELLYEDDRFDNEKLKSFRVTMF
jgi:Cdc6-like AAA superfamily ATPase